MRPAKVTRAEAEALMAQARANGFADPKPVPALKPRWKLKRGPAPKRKTALRAYSEATRQRIKAWPGLKRAIFDRDKGICQLCGAQHERWTAHHVWPQGPDHETNLVLIGLANPSGNGFSGCHAAAHHDLRASKESLGRKLCEKYRALPDADLMIRDGTPAQFAYWNALEEARREVYSQHDKGVRRLRGRPEDTRQVSVPEVLPLASKARKGSAS
jgi:hypothetical protein